MAIRIDSIRECLDGVIPCTIATFDAEGMPNAAFLSQVQFVDHEHVALSYQFFNKTRRNVLANPDAKVLVTSHLTLENYLLHLRYLRTESAGPLFEQMKAKLAGIASHTGMSGVFRLLGADVYRILDIEAQPGNTVPAPPPPRNALTALRRCAERLDRCSGLDALLQAVLDALEAEFDIHHSMLLLLDAPRGQLYTLASRGYAPSGVGSEIPVGQGVIGVAARERTAIRIGHMTTEYAYGRTIREGVRASASRSGVPDGLETEIPLPGLPQARSQLAVPIVALQQLLGVLYVESTEDSRFGYDDEDALVTLAAQLGAAIHLLQQQAVEAEEPPPPAAAAPATGGGVVSVRYYAENGSVFLDGHYLIKGVAGAILRTLLGEYVEHGRTDFTNKELRLDPRIGLPDLSDNLEARLVLLQRRLDERDACIRLLKTGRGCLRLCVTRPLRLLDL
ncbi:adenylate cyclase [Plasticicumulans lactativorans]|uniref:Adenylate cyclase n=1 Tax=Plasticicumulans lactativorans TaxID=1133106 RepID=A0A4R2L651_9GAMM|nr:GAF domain-containing protein [Plasticicumulans lactativorans]TCO80757.1 adenylate cyclase [Plasticicumulans lactativorans]